MNKLLFEKFSSKILTAGPILQFILIVLCNNVHYYSSDDPSYTNLFILINFIGLLSLVTWYHAIAFVSNFHIEKNENVFVKAKFVEATIIVYFFLESCMMFFDFEIHHLRIDLGIIITIKYTDPFIITLLYSVCYLFSLINISRMIKFAETQRIVGFSEYYKTALLLIFPIIGIWVIDARLKKLKFIEKLVDDVFEEEKSDEYLIKLQEAIDSEAVLNKIEYKCKEGLLVIYQEFQNPNIGEKVFLNNKKATDGKYKIGFMCYIIVKDGRVEKASMI